MAEGVESVTAINNLTSRKLQFSQRFFVAIGHKPNTDLFRNQLDMDENGYIIVKAGTTKTNIDGVFASGDVVDHVYDKLLLLLERGAWLH